MSFEHRIVTPQTQSTEHHNFFGKFHGTDFWSAQRFCRLQRVDSNDAQRKLAGHYITGVISFSIRGTSTYIRSLTAALLHPNFSSAPEHSNQPIIHKPFSGDIPLKGYSLPSLKDIEDLLRSIPHLKA
jgi:hypothetical protein